jgi:DNA-binding NtrC family response regulator
MISDGNAYIVVVDDESIIANTTALILRSEGFDAVAFKHPLDAIEHCKANRIDLLISDVHMPGMSGIELAISIRERHPDADVQLISGMATTNDVTEEARDLGHNFPVLIKPLHPKELVAVVARIIERRAQR